MRGDIDKFVEMK